MVLRGTYSALSQNNRGSGGRGPLWVNRYRSLAVEPDAKSAVARKLT